MQIIIHRGTQEVGGSCIEIRSGESRIILDVGLPLFDKDRQPLDTRLFQSQSTEDLLNSGIIPAVEGLVTGDRHPDAIILSHAHLDHCGLLDRTNSKIPVYATSGTSKMMLAGSLFAGQVEIPRARFRKLAPEQPIQIGNFRVTAYSVDHSIFGAVAILVEADGQSLLYSGDLRLHGRKTGMAKKLISALQNKKLDVLLMEGTHLGSVSNEQTTEYQLEDQIVEHVKNTPSLVLASFSPQHVDRLVTFIRTAIKTKRIIVVDVYTAFVMHLLSRETKIPIPGIDEKLRIFFPKLFWENESKRKMLAEKCPQFLAKQIEIEEIRLHPENFLMVFRASMLETDFAGRLPPGTLCLHSRWEGYLEQPDALDVNHAINNAGGQMIQAHISGHIRREDIFDLVELLKPRAIVPVHTFERQQLSQRFQNVLQLNDGELFEVS